ncbi:unnamed protein product [Owenia fusiformis]|uniref:CCHC-type domain-containing protein n=1 Tax=Owenia fusiformis TaxID=6347 RepID=A0A8S4PTB1_OWEFU|nr:unnamed protein product [Owenia fusiformis]
MTSFIDALNDSAMEWHVQSTSPKTLNEALTSALKYESFKRGRAKWLTPNIGRDDNSTLLVETNLAVNKMIFSEMESRLQTLEKSLSERNRGYLKPRPCGICKSQEHLTMHCPKKHPNSKGGARCCWICGSSDHYFPECPRKQI